jgi:hypothetical protein
MPRTLVVVLTAVVVLALQVGSRKAPPPSEEDIVLPPAAEAPRGVAPSAIPPPAVSDLQPTLDRAFDQTLAVDHAAKPNHVAGDFNGDDVTDIAVAVLPRSGDALSNINADLPRWSLQDAAPPAAGAAARPERVKVGNGERLLAVVHGVGAVGWRDPEAGQRYLVRNAVTSGMRLQPLAGMPEDVRLRVIRSHVGDVIAGERGGEAGLVFWTGAAYAWAALEREKAP